MRLGEYDERLAAMMANMEAHIIADAKAFAFLGDQLIELNRDVKSILASRSFASGVWKAIAIGSGAFVGLGTLVLLAIQVLRMH